MKIIIIFFFSHIYKSTKLSGCKNDDLLCYKNTSFQLLIRIPDIEKWLINNCAAIQVLSKQDQHQIITKTKTTIHKNKTPNTFTL
jgi:hypothetical protein